MSLMETLLCARDRFRKYIFRTQKLPTFVDPRVPDNEILSMVNSHEAVTLIDKVRLGEDHAALPDKARRAPIRLASLMCSVELFSIHKPEGAAVDGNAVQGDPGAAGERKARRKPKLNEADKWLKLQDIVIVMKRKTTKSAALRNAEYVKKDKKECITIDFEGRAKVSMFSTGRMTIMGAKSEATVKKEVTKIVKLLQEHFPDLSVSSRFRVNVHNKVAYFRLPFVIDISGLMQMVGERLLRNFSNKFHSLCCGKLVVKVFHRGCIGIVNFSDRFEAYRLFLNIYPLLKACMRLGVSAEQCRLFGMPVPSEVSDSITESIEERASREEAEAEQKRRDFESSFFGMAMPIVVKQEDDGGLPVGAASHYLLPPSAGGAKIKHEEDEDVDMSNYMEGFAPPPALDLPMSVNPFSLSMFQM